MLKIWKLSLPGEGSTMLLLGSWSCLPAPSPLACKFSLPVASPGLGWICASPSRPWLTCHHQWHILVSEFLEEETSQTGWVGRGRVSLAQAWRWQEVGPWVSRMGSGPPEWRVFISVPEVTMADMPPAENQKFPGKSSLNWPPGLSHSSAPSTPLALFYFSHQPYKGGAIMSSHSTTMSLKWREVSLYKSPMWALGSGLCGPQDRPVKATPLPFSSLADMGRGESWLRLQWWIQSGCLVPA